MRFSVAYHHAPFCYILFCPCYSRALISYAPLCDLALFPCTIFARKRLLYSRALICYALYALFSCALFSFVHTIFFCSRYFTRDILICVIPVRALSRLHSIQILQIHFSNSSIYFGLHAHQSFLWSAHSIFFIIS